MRTYLSWPLDGAEAILTVDIDLALDAPKWARAKDGLGLALLWAGLGPVRNSGPPI